jgi:hypothetical protein
LVVALLILDYHFAPLFKQVPFWTRCQDDIQIGFKSLRSRENVRSVPDFGRFSYYFRAHNLVIASEFHVPYLTPIARESVLEPDLMLVRSEGKRLPLVAPRNPGSIQRDDLYVIDQGGTLAVRFANHLKMWIDGPTIRLAWPSPMSTAELSHCIMHAVLPLALSVRGYQFLHAGAVVTAADHTLLLLGESGRGKSTLATWFASNGARLLSDDAVRIGKQAEKWVAFPSYPSVSLRPDTQSRLFRDVAPAYRTASGSRKIRVEAAIADCSMSIAERASELICAYVLLPGRTTEPVITRMSSTSALPYLMKSTFGLTIQPKQYNASGGALDQAIDLCAALPFFSLSFRKSWRSLPNVAKRVAEHAASVAKSAAI